LPDNLELLVGDNPFHGISHLDQGRAKTRGAKITESRYAANLVKLGLENGAQGFMFSVSETTTGILRNLRQDSVSKNISLWPIFPYAYEYVRYAVQSGITGLGMRFAKQLARSLNFRAMFSSLRGYAKSDMDLLVQSLALYELSRVRQSAGKNFALETLMLHEVITDMALALGLDQFFASYVDFASDKRILPGFETRNFAFLVRKFNEWKIDLDRVAIAAPFNKIGFQMSPSKQACEETLASLKNSNVVAMSILASGYINLEEALDYVSTLPNLRGAVIGVSNETQAQHTFSTAREQIVASYLLPNIFLLKGVV
jgi:hypothetical protein